MTDEVIQALRAMQDGRLDLVEGCRIVTKALTRMKEGFSTSGAAATIFGVESETDTFPIGPERDHWDPAAVARADAERSAYVDTIRERLLAACSELAVELQRKSGLGDER